MSKSFIGDAFGRNFQNQSSTASKNRFTAFQDADHVSTQQSSANNQQQKRQQDADKVTAKKKEALKKGPTRVIDNPDEFARVEEQTQVTGGRGGRRGGKRNRDESDEEEEEQQSVQGRGSRGGRGRGEGRGGRGGRGGYTGKGRPRATDMAGRGDAQVERAEAGGHRERFHGKAREDAHPMDRQDGTGRGHRGDRKGGNQRGGWGGTRPSKEDANPDADNTGARGQDEERKEVRRAPVVVEEEEEIGYTLDDYNKEKQAKSKGLLGQQTQVREREAVQDKVLGRDAEKVNVQKGESNLSWRDNHAIRSVDNAALMGFSGNDYDEDSRDDRRGGRGGRRDEPRQGARKGRAGAQVEINDDDFPAL